MKKPNKYEKVALRALKDRSETGAGINFYVYCVKKNVVEDMLYKEAHENGITYLYKQLGWDGGTIHQLRDEILKRKVLLNQE